MEDSEKASADMGRFGRQMELEADREGLMMMAHAGYHPDFVPALIICCMREAWAQTRRRCTRCIRAGKSATAS